MSVAERPEWDQGPRGLAQRVLGDLAERVRFAPLPGPARRFSYAAQQGQVVVSATDAGSAAVGLHAYLRRHCHLMVQWDDLRPPPPEQLPDAPPTDGEARVPETYYLNFCTYSYTMAWWDWEQWEREIDWMALHGVTAPLMMVGHEAVLERVLRDEGLDRGAVDGFLSGPAYLPFLVMGTLDGFAGPLPSAWMADHRDLGGRILARQRELGMRPVLPAFTGHVPAALAGEEGARDWQGHRTHVIGPEDPRFRRLAAATVRVQQEFWGTDHRYASDPFIEMVPVVDDPGYPGRVATELLAGLTDADPEAVWYLQTWPFSYQREFWTESRVRAFLDAIPAHRLTLLDLWAETAPQWSRFDAFAGRDWIWCALLNFGGRSDPLANLTGLDTLLDEAFDSDNPPTGIGLSMEATRQAPVYFERLLDLTWREAPPLQDWFDAWVHQRYGLDDAALIRQAADAWRALAATTLSSGESRIFPSGFNGLITARPAAQPFAQPDLLPGRVADLLWYDPAKLITAWQGLVAVAESAPDAAAGPLGRDLVDAALAVLPRYAELCFLAGYDEGGVIDPGAAARFLGVFDDLEELLATRPEFRYDTWEREALRWAHTDADHGLLADNARRLLTVWGRTGDGYLDDYACRLWAGLVGYYKARWLHWIERHPVQAANEADLEAALRHKEDTFLRDGPATVPTGGDVVTVSRRLLDTYADDFVRTAVARTG